jgi:hypothetical protein
MTERKAGGAKLGDIRIIDGCRQQALRKQQSISYRISPNSVLICRDYDTHGVR